MMRLPPAQSISFDVAITAMKGAKTHGGVAVFAGAFGLGSKGQSERTDESVNRIQFSVLFGFRPANILARRWAQTD